MRSGRSSGGFQSTTISSESRPWRLHWPIQAFTKVCIRRSRLPPWSSFRAVTTTERYGRLSNIPASWLRPGFASASEGTGTDEARKLVRPRPFIQAEVKPVSLQVEQISQHSAHLRLLGGSQISMKAVVGRIQSDTISRREVQRRNRLFHRRINDAQLESRSRPVVALPEPMTAIFELLVGTVSGIRQIVHDDQMFE